MQAIFMQIKTFLISLGPAQSCPLENQKKKKERMIYSKKKGRVKNAEYVPADEA